MRAAVSVAARRCACFLIFHFSFYGFYGFYSGFSCFFRPKLPYYVHANLIHLRTYVHEHLALCIFLASLTFSFPNVDFPRGSPYGSVLIIVN